MKRKLLQINLTLGIIFILISGVSAQTVVSGKEKNVDEIVDLTITTFPSAEVQKAFDAFKTAFPNTLKPIFAEKLKQKINAQKGLTAAQKKKAIEKSPILIEKIGAYIEQAAEKKFGRVELIVAAYFKEKFADYSDAEILELKSFLKSPAGKSFLTLAKQISDNRFLEQPKEIAVDEQYILATGEFVDTLLGKKYEKTRTDANIFMSKQMESAPEVFGQELANDKKIINMIVDFIKKDFV
jgi:hypothetical protein